MSFLSNVGGKISSAFKDAGNKIAPAIGAGAGPGGVDVKRPTDTTITPGTDANQIAGAYQGVNNGLGSQQALLSALQGQGGISDQNAALGNMQGLGQQLRGLSGTTAQGAALSGQEGLYQALMANQGAQNVGSAFNQTQGLANQLAGANGVGNMSNAYNQTQGLAGQLAGANGVGNLSNAYNQTQGLANQLAGANGVGNMSSALQQQQALAQQQAGTLGQYQNIANGTGPNPAMAMLNQQTGANVANQAALMAGQRGAGANVGLLARQAAQQGAATQQQAVGQGATMQAQQQLNALSGLTNQQQAIGSTNQSVAGIAAQQLAAQQAQQGNLGNIASQQIAQQQSQQAALAGQAAQQVSAQQAQQGALAGQAAQQVGQQQNALGAAQQAASGITGQQMNQQQNVAGQANTIVGNQIGATNANTAAQQAEQSTLQGALANQNQQNVSMQSNINSANAAIAQTGMQGQQKIIGGLGQAIGVGTGLIPGAGAARGGEVPGMAEGGDTARAAPAPLPVQAPSGPQSYLGKFLQGYKENAAEDTATTDPLQKGMANLTKALAQKMGTPAASRGGKVDMTGGGNITARSSSEKATKPGNDYANDKIPAMVSEHEIVIPRSITLGSDPVRGAADFVAKVLAKKRSA